MQTNQTRLVSLGAALLLTVGCITAYGYTAPIKTHEKGYQALRLPAVVYNQANPDLSDLRILDEAGGQVPYFLNNAQLLTNYTTKEYPLVVADRFQKEGVWYIDLALQTPQPQGSDLQANSLQLRLERGSTFAAEVELQGSHDGVQWERAGNDTLYQVEGNEKLTLRFPASQKYTHYRLGFGTLPQLPAIGSGTLVEDHLQMSQNYFVDSLRPDFSVEQQGRETVVTIQGAKNLRLKGISLETASTFQREVSALGERQTLYNLSLGETAYSSLELPMEGNQSREDLLVLHIQNNDDRPIQLDGLTLLYYADELVFEFGLGYSLEFGADDTKTAPVYDISSYAGRILEQETMARADLGLILQTPPQPLPPQEKDYSQLFSWCLISVTVLLLVLVVVRIKKLKA